ncbi:ADP-ribosylglycohydrolase [Diaminobutyricimonas aerilata]|uniref:ADP-ribosylglycohydrolase n=1 Tax=Diaminobutyricimonas aerilata TaxID=1162967 RepID=A0A2M9CNQ4_9MICO|nr:ADP-ribosylglycohydrolase family protein [Diaminobutyricimonas aerilata]PJJ73512.1 ADP-ribosylglycohydrolase [Diaminobutyricimonas aerilata]
MDVTDRAVGVLLGCATGDALGAAYEFQPPLAPDVPVEMRGERGTRFAPGEWTDDTAMSVPLAQAAAAGRDLLARDTLDWVVGEWMRWAETSSDIGAQTKNVFARLREPDAKAAAAAGREVHELTGRSGGNGSVMRTAPVALAFLDDERGLAEAARTISRLTHFDPDAGDACVLWCLAIRHTVLTGQLDVRVGLGALGGEAAERWSLLLDDAEGKQPSDFQRNGWVVEALQGAWSAICAGVDLVDVLERAVRGGNDTDTVAAIAGSLAGAAYGAGGIPTQWRDIVHGWPGLTADDLADLAARIVSRHAVR